MKTKVNPPANLPQDLTKLTEDQYNGLVAYYRSLPLAELRKRQDANEGRYKTIQDEHTRFGFKTMFDPMSPRLAVAWRNLDIDGEILIEAIHRQTFGDEAWDQWARRDEIDGIEVVRTVCT